MTQDSAKQASPPTQRGDDLRPAITALEELYRRARKRVLDHVTEGARISSRSLDKHQLAAHALAYLATELEAAGSWWLGWKAWSKPAAPGSWSAASPAPMWASCAAR